MKRHGGKRKYDTTTISCEALPPSDMMVIRRCLATGILMILVRRSGSGCQVRLSRSGGNPCQGWTNRGKRGDRRKSFIPALVLYNEQGPKDPSMHLFDFE